VLNSFALLDFDYQISQGGAMTYEAYKNQIFDETQKIVEEELEVARVSDDASLHTVVKSYDDPSIVPDAAASERFKNIVKARINANLETYVDKFSAHELEKIKEECYAGADI
jgi:hypothetical protein